MADKPKITHFAPEDSPASSRSSAAQDDRSDLAALYPAAKTLDEKAEDEERLRKSYRLRWPKRPHLNIAAYGSVVLAGAVLFAQNVYTWVFSSVATPQAMTSVFFSFGIALGLVFAFTTWVHYVNQQFGYFGGKVRLFWCIYIVFVAIILPLWLNGVIWNHTNIVWVPLLTILHAAVVFFSARYILEEAA